MKNRYRKFRRGNVWWCHDSQTGKQTTLKTKSKNDAIRLLDSMNQPYQNAGFHLEMARTHLNQGDARRITRNWQNVFDDIIRAKTGSTKFRWERAAKDKAYVSILGRVVVETTPDDFLNVFKLGKTSTNVFLRRLHNFAFGMNWLLAPIIPINAWPKVEFGEKRAITADEHRRIIEREKNPERRAFYEMCWHVGGSQTDMATLTAENIDWQNRTLTYFRMKTGTRAQLEIGLGLEKLLQCLPAKGNLFPYLATVREADRATEFRQRCNGLGIAGVTLHSYRYSWAERAKTPLTPAIHSLIQWRMWNNVFSVVKVPLYSEIKAQEARHRRVVMKQRGTRSAMARQRQVSLVGGGAKWQITNLPQVLAAMAKWA